MKDKVMIDSCAVTSYFLGAPADPRIVAAAHKKGIAIDHKAKLFEEKYFKIFDPIIAADQSTLKVLQAMAPEADRQKLHLATDYSRSFKGQDIQDPYYDGEGLFDKTIEMAEEIAQELFTKFIDGR